MKKIIYTLLISFFVFTNNTTAQEDETKFNGQDTFTYKKIDVIDREDGNLSISGNTIKQDSRTKDNFTNKSSDPGIGEIQGDLSVSLTGAAVYNIPINVPQGIDGIAPEISLNYNSQSGNGLVAYGWNIKGISVISRIPASKFHDNQIDGVDFDNLDRFALDGNRLVLKSGTYGANGAQYETERYSNLKITSHGTSPYGASYGPSYFIVHYPDGSKAEYGNSSDSKSRLNYAITYWENPQGVRISYEYMIDVNSQYIKKIKYGSLNADTPINEIVFSYSGNIRHEKTYINDVAIIRTKSLYQIESFSSGAKFRRYDFNVSSSAASLHYNRLSSIREFSGDELHHHSNIKFRYDAHSSIDPFINYSGITTIGLSNIEQRNSSSVSLDMTGNGKMDFIVYPKIYKNKFWMFYDIQSNGNNNPYEVSTGYFETIFPSTLLNQQNKILSGQGLTIVQKGTGGQVNFKVYSKASAATGLPIGYDYTKIWNSPTYNYYHSLTDIEQKEISKEYISGDFNGDGLTDVLAIGKPYIRRTCFDDCPPVSGVNGQHRPPSGGDSCCNTTNVNQSKVYFINLRRDVPSNFANNAGYLQLPLNGDYKLQTGDFNGDGKTDLLHIANGALYIYTLNNDNSLSLLWRLFDSGINTTDPLILGDFNGDGKTDFLDPIANNSSLFRTFFSTGVSFAINTITMPFKYVKTNWDGDNGELLGYNLVPLDVNGDGKTDIVEYKTVTQNNGSDGVQVIKIYNNFGISADRIKFIFGGEATKIGNLEHFPIPIFLTSNRPNKNLEFASISNNWITNFVFEQDHREDVLLRSIMSNKTSYRIHYKNLDYNSYNSDNMKVYYTSSNESYPNIDLEIAPSTKIVSMLQRFGSEQSIDNPDMPTIKKIYAYQGAVINAEGLGFLGFKGIAESNWHTGVSDRIFTVSKYDHSLRGAMIENYSMVNNFTFNTPSNYISKNMYQYSSSLSSTKVFKLWLDSSFNENNLEGTNKHTTYQYDLYNNPTNILTNFIGGSNNQHIEYYNNTGVDYYIGRPKKTISSTTINGDIFTTEQQFVYTGYLLTQKKMKSNTSPFDIETYNYDSFGNIIKKIITPYGEAQREIEFEYDTSGRFLKKSIDVEGLETAYEYNTVLGVLTKVINPFGQATIYEHDSWGRKIKMFDYLGNEAMTSYVEDSENAYTIASTANDGSETMVKYDKLKRLEITKKKNVLGAWVSTNYKYDALDRLIKVSEPYTGDNPLQWNETTYDLYGRPIRQTLHTGRVINISYNGLTTTVDDGIKIVSSTKNQLGNTMSVTDPGGTINYTYYGNGGLKAANYNGVIVTTEQDDWGRKTKLIDPSAGTFEYSYNGFGEIISEITPKGETEYVYSPLGKLLEKDITGDNNDMSIQYVYNPVHKFLNSISVSNSDGNDCVYNYTYDSDIRLKSVSETTPYAVFTKQYTYDTYGRVFTEEYYGKLLSNGKTSTKKIKNIYQNGVLKTIKDFTTNSNIWDVTGVNARGQLTSSSIGNNIESNKAYDIYGYLTNTEIAKGTGATAEILMQLTTDFDVQKGRLNSRSNSMFSWSETFGYDNLDRLITFNDNDGNNTINYDNLGRITSNNTVGTYNYSGTSYQLADMDLNLQGDLYYQQNRLEQIKYNAFKKPIEINEEGKEKISFQYNAFRMRSNMFYGGTEDDISLRNNRKHYSHDGSMEISYDEEQDTTLFVTYIGGDAYSAPAIWRSEQGMLSDNNYYYLHRDYLGSILLITDVDGNAKEKRHFDAWGKIVKLTDGNGTNLDKLTFLDRGYTGHEHLQGVKLIHMNGRLYDPNLKRFLAPDNNIQDISNTQNFNRYSYVLNNPLMYVDSSGETFDTPPSGEFSWGNSILGFVIATIINTDWDSLLGDKGIDFRNFRDSATRIHHKRLREWREFWGAEKEGSRDVEYSNYGNLSSDPLAGSSNGNTLSTYGAGGTDTGGLGVTNGYNGSGYKLTIKQMLTKHGYDIYGRGRGKIKSFKATSEYIMKVIHTIPELEADWIKGGSPKLTRVYNNENSIAGATYYPSDYSLEKGNIAGVFVVNAANINNNYKLVTGLFHEFSHAFWDVSKQHEYFSCEIGEERAYALDEVTAYEYSWSLGGYTNYISENTYNRHLNRYLRK